MSHGQNVTVDVVIGSKCQGGRSVLGGNVQAAKTCLKKSTTLLHFSWLSKQLFVLDDITKTMTIFEKVKKLFGIQENELKWLFLGGKPSINTGNSVKV